MMIRGGMRQKPPKAPADRMGGAMSGHSDPSMPVFTRAPGLYRPPRINMDGARVRLDGGVIRLRRLWLVGDAE